MHYIQHTREATQQVLYREATQQVLYMILYALATLYLCWPVIATVHIGTFLLHSIDMCA